MIPRCYNGKQAIGVKLFSSLRSLEIFHNVLATHLGLVVTRHIWRYQEPCGEGLRWAGCSAVICSVLVRKATNSGGPQTPVWKPRILSHRQGQSRSQGCFERDLCATTAEAGGFLDSSPAMKRSRPRYGSQTAKVGRVHQKFYWLQKSQLFKACIWLFAAPSAAIRAWKCAARPRGICRGLFLCGCPRAGEATPARRCRPVRRLRVRQARGARSGAGCFWGAGKTRSSAPSRFCQSHHVLEGSAELCCCGKSWVFEQPKGFKLNVVPYHHSSIVRLRNSVQ